MADISFTLEKPQEKLIDKPRLSSESSEPSDGYPCVSCIDDTILPPRRKLPANVAKKLTQAGRWLAIITLISTLAMTGFGFFISQVSDSSAMFGFAFDSFFALISSSILIWRFSLDDQNSYMTVRRETHATAAVAICMIVSSIAVFVRAIDLLYHSDKPEKPIELLILTSTSLLIYFILFVSKYSVAKNLGSGCLLTDAMDSLWGAIFALSILVSAIVLKFTTKVWYLDSSIAIIVSVCSFIYGAIVLEKLLRLFKKREDKARREYEYTLLHAAEENEDTNEQQEKN